MTNILCMDSLDEDYAEKKNISTSLCYIFIDCIVFISYRFKQKSDIRNTVILQFKKINYDRYRILSIHFLLERHTNMTKKKTLNN